MRNYAPIKLTALAGIMALNLILIGNAFAAEKIRFATPVKEQPYYFLTALAAEEGGFWKKNGLDGEWVPFGSASAMFYAVSAGQVNAGLTASLSVIQGVARGVPVVAIIDTGLKAGWFIWVPTASPIRRAEELKGKKAAVVGFGGAEHAYGRLGLRALGLEKDVRFVAVGGGLPAKAAALKAGGVEAMVASIPTVVGLRIAGEIREVVSIDEHLPRKWLEYLIYVHNDLAKNNPEATRRAARALLGGMSYVQDNPRWAIEKIKSMTGYPEEGARALYKEMTYSRDGKIDGEALQNVVNFLTEYGIVSKDKAPKLEQLYTARFTE